MLCIAGSSSSSKHLHLHLHHHHHHNNHHNFSALLATVEGSHKSCILHSFHRLLWLLSTHLLLLVERYSAKSTNQNSNTQSKKSKFKIHNLKNQKFKYTIQKKPCHIVIRPSHILIVKLSSIDTRYEKTSSSSSS